MLISLIAAYDENRGMGLRGGLPWRLGDDKRLFKALTMGRHLVLGRRTYESIGRALPGRTMILVTRRPEDCPAGLIAAASLAEALHRGRERGETEIFITGGAGLYREALPLAGRFYRTRVHTTAEADTFFPPFDETEWEVVTASEYPASDRNEVPFTFEILQRKTG